MLKNEDFEKVCKLAKIKIDDNEKDLFLSKMNSVFEWIDQLSKIDVSSVDINNLEDMDDTPERLDIPKIKNSVGDVLSNTNHKKFDMFCVPKVVD